MSKAKKLFIYDWDDNIMIMPSILHLEEKSGTNWVRVEVTPSRYAKIKNNANFRDFGEESYFDFHNNDIFIEHLDMAITNKSFGPSFKNFKETLINGDDFAILTARGHSPHRISAGVMLLIIKTFTPSELNKMIHNVGSIAKYLDNQEYYTVSSEEFIHQFQIDESVKTKDRKSKALYKYITEQLKYYNDFIIDEFEVIFSDDDVDNIEAAVALFHKLKVIHPIVEFKVLDTSKKNKKEITI